MTTAGDTSLVDTILGLAGHLQLSTVAEGIEHEHQRAALATQGCVTGQGYHFSPPVTADLIPELVASALLAGTGEPTRGVRSGAAAPSPPRTR